MHSQRTARRWFDGAACVVFAAIIFLPGAARYTGWAAPFDMQAEKRAAAKLPELDVRRRGPLWIPRKGSLAVFPTQFEAYFNDAYGGRAELLAMYSQARIAGWVPAALESPPAGGETNGRVLIGRRGWLYLSGECVDNYRATRPLPESDLDAWQRTLEERRRWLAERGIEYVFMVAPEKHTLYPENLPTSVNRVGAQSRLDQLAARMQNAAVPILDVREPLLIAKTLRPTYLQTDTHWNSYGAWIGYGQLVGRLHERFPMLPAPNLDDYVLSATTETGDLAAMLPSASWQEGSRTVMTPKRLRRAVVRQEELDVGRGEYVACRTAENPAAPAGRALVIHDSFYWAMQPLMDEDWRHVTYVDNRYDFPAELIERQRPDVVVEEIAERRLMRSPPVNPPLPAAQHRDVQTAVRPGESRSR